MMSSLDGAGCPPAKVMTLLQIGIALLPVGASVLPVMDRYVPVARAGNPDPDIDTC